MYKISLFVEEKQILEERNRHSKDVHESDRLKAILLRNAGCNVLCIAQALRIHETSVTRFISDYCNSNKLQSESRGSDK